MEHRMLIRKEDQRLVPIQSLLVQVSHKVAILWALECAQELLGRFELISSDRRVASALEAGYLWAFGTITMKEAKASILAAHKAASEAYPDMVAMSFARAIAQAASTVHTKKHAIGVVLYSFTAVSYQTEANNKEETLTKLLDWFYQTLVEVNNRTLDENHTWAKFIK